MRTNEILKELRRRSGKYEAEIALQAGLSLESYCDLEAYEDEFTDFISLAQARLIANALGGTLDTILVSGVRIHLPLNDAELREVLRKARESMGYSFEFLGELIGYEGFIIRNLEEIPNYKEILCISAINDLADELHIERDLLY